MKTLFKNCRVADVFTDSLYDCDVLTDGENIVGVGSYEESDADSVIDVQKKYVCPGLIDGHIHIESTMMIPARLAEISLPHGTTSIVADPHEIANVAGTAGIDYMLKASENIPLNVYFTLSSCVPATDIFDESGAVLTAEDLLPYYSDRRIVGLAEMMNYPGVIYNDPNVHAKIRDALAHGRVVDGHAPLLSGHELDAYLAAGITSDHECTNLQEALEKLSKGMCIMIRDGSAAQDLAALIRLFDEPYNRRCILATDDRHPTDLIRRGHIDALIRKAVRLGANPIKAVRMASLQAAAYFRIPRLGAIAPGYRADFLILDDLNEFVIHRVYSRGQCAAEYGRVMHFDEPKLNREEFAAVFDSFNVAEVSESDFHIEEKSDRVRVIQSHAGSLLTDGITESMDWKNNGIDLAADRIKLAVIERHHGTGHRGLGFIRGSGLKTGALASSISHDSHNLIVMGTNEGDMALAANTVIRMGGGIALVQDGSVRARIELPVAGLMSEESAHVMAEKNTSMRNALVEMGVSPNATPIMTLAFISLSVIPHLKMTTKGLVNADRFELTDLYV